MNSELSVVIPAYNEEESIGRTLAETLAYLHKGFERFEIIVVDDGSGDRTRSIVEAVAAAHPPLLLIKQERNQGKGMAVKTGIAAARYSRCLFMDADGATSIEEWPAFEKAFRSGARAVQASRHLPGSSHSPSTTGSPHSWIRVSADLQANVCSSSNGLQLRV